MTEFLARVGDRVNPIVVKETRQAVGSRLVGGFLLVFLAVQLVATLLMISGREMGNADDMNLRAGRDMFTFVQGILLGTCMILIPAMTGVRLGAERSDVNVDLLFISSLTPRAVIAGKLFAAGALALLIFSACAPFMTFAYVMRGLDVPTILIVLAVDFLVVILGTTLVLFLASVPANRGLRILLGLQGFIAVCYLGGGVMTITGEFLHGGAAFDTGSWEFWAGCAGLAALIFGVIGLLFVWSVALISPPSTNRAFAVRVYTFALSIALVVGFGIWSYQISRPEPMLMGCLSVCTLFALQIIISICERDRWGARVACRIPRRALLRLPAFFFFSGAAGGIFFGVIGVVLSLFGLVVWLEVLPYATAWRSRSDEMETVMVAALIAAYVYCYSLTAAVLRRAFNKSTFRPGYTWILAIFLFALGSAVPAIVRFIIVEGSQQYTHRDEMTALYLTNPVVMIQDAITTSAPYLGFTLVFLLLWGGLVTALNIPWFALQAARFHPPKIEKRADG